MPAIGARRFPKRINKNQEMTDIEGLPFFGKRRICLRVDNGGHSSIPVEILKFW